MTSAVCLCVQEEVLRCARVNARRAKTKLDEQEEEPQVLIFNIARFGLKRSILTERVQVALGSPFRSSFAPRSINYRWPSKEPSYPSSLRFVRLLLTLLVVPPRRFNTKLPKRRADKISA